MIDSVERSEYFKYTLDSIRKHRRGTVEDLRESLSEFPKVCQIKQEAQHVTFKTELLNRMSTILQMRRELSMEEAEELHLLNKYISKVKNALFELQD